MLRHTVTVTVPAVQEEVVDSITNRLAALSLPVKAVEAIEASTNSLSAKLDATIGNDALNRRIPTQRSDAYVTAANTGAYPGACYMCGELGCRAYNCPWTRKMIETGKYTEMRMEGFA